MVLRPRGWFWAGLGFSVAFFTAVYFIIGFQLEPLTSTRKIVLLAFLATVFGLLLDALPVSRRYIYWLLGTFSSAAMLWVVWPLLMRKTGVELWLLAISSIAYAAWLAIFFERQRPDQPSVHAAVFAVCLGTSVSALFGASALLGQLGGAMAASMSVFVLAGLAGRTVTTGISLTFPAALLASLIGVAGTVYATLPWFSLIPIALIPASLTIPLPASFSDTQKFLAICAITICTALVASGISWQVSGAPPL